MSLPSFAALYPHLVILGAGGLAREAYWYALENGVEHIGLVDETVPRGTALTWTRPTDRLVTEWVDFTRDTTLAHFRHFIVAVGKPETKRRLVRGALSAGLIPADTLVGRGGNVHGRDNHIGRGGIVAPGCLATTNVTIGDYVTLGVNCAVGHDASLGDFVTCNPGSLVSGNVTLSDGVLLGAGACVLEKLSVASNVTIGAQACVVKSVTAPGVTIMGVPASTKPKSQS